MALHYHEYRGLDAWCPAISATPITITQVGGHMRLKTPAGVGPRVRKVGPVPAGLQGKSLDELQELCPEDGWKAEEV